MDALTLSISKSYTDETVVGGGAIKGKNCTVDSITHDDNNHCTVVTFKYTLDDGTVKTSQMNVPDGAQGEQGPSGQDGADGRDGVNGQDGADGVGIASITANGNILTITYTDGDTDTIEIPTVSASALEDLGDVSLNNLTDNQILKYDSSSAKWINANESGGGGSSESDYSEKEKIIGSWIDGKPVYQKTIVLQSAATISYNSWSSIGVTVESLSIDKLIDAKGYTSSGAYNLDVSTSNSEVSLQAVRNGANLSNVTAVTIRYIKTSN